jgi:cytochrome c peroxidase
MRKFRWLLLMSLIWMACSDPQDDLEFELPAFDDMLYDFDFGSHFHEPTNLPADNLPTEQGVLLGRMLFYDPILSKDSSQSCSSCHQQAIAFSDNRPFSIGVEGHPGLRQSMSLANLAWVQNGYFWDGRSALLRDQVLFPIQDPLEMNESLDNMLAKLNNSRLYREQYARAFGIDQIDTKHTTLALEQFLVSLVSIRSKYDRYLDGEVELTPSELRGKNLFENDFSQDPKARSGSHCGHCHGLGPTFSDNVEFMNNGLDGDDEFSDFGRENVTNNPGDRARFRVPTLRNIAVTGPYMHDGRFETLEEVLDFYNGQIKESSTASREILRTKAGLMLTEEDKRDIINFLKTLTDESLLTDEKFASPF